MTAVTKMRDARDGFAASNGERLIETRARFWTEFEWSAALEHGDHDRRRERLDRDFDKARRQAFAQDFEAALASRAYRGRIAFRAERRRLARERDEAAA